MSSIFRLQIQPASFWLGFLLATLFWWIAIGIRRAWPRIQQLIAERAKEIRERNLSGLESYLRQETVQRAQKQHIAAPLFALDEILLEPHLLAAPPAPDPEAPPADSMTQLVVPYLPDFPILASQYAVPRLTLEEALQNGANIAVIGQPGTGKTVALADFASRLARRQISTAVGAKIPFYLNVFDLLPQDGTPSEPFDLLQKAISRRILVIYQPQVKSFLESALQDGKALLILDGLDSLPENRLTQAGSLLKNLLRTYPRLQMLLAASPDFLDGLTSIGVQPLALETWRPEDASQFIGRWSEAWEKWITPQIKRQYGQNFVESSFLVDWLAPGTTHLSPLEWTLRTWAMFSGDLYGSQPIQWLEAYVQRMLQNQVPLEAAAALAARSIQGQEGDYSFGDLEKQLSRYQLSTTAAKPAPEASEEKPDGSQKTEAKKGAKAPALTSGARILNQMLDSGLLVQYGDDRITFQQPTVCGYLASLMDEIESSYQPDVEEVPSWSLLTSYLRYRMAQGKALEWADHLLSIQSQPLHPNLMLVGRWLNDVPASASWRTAFMRRLVQFLQDESLPRSLRIRAIAIFIGANDPSTGTLFKQLLASPSPVLRQLAALACGAIRESKVVQDLIGLLADPNPEVQYAACLALSRIPSPIAEEAVNAVLYEGDEALRLLAVEALAGKGMEGHETLRQFAESEDMIIRRAAVAGLSHIHEDWVHPILQKIAIEDGQWVVRTAAAQAIESLELKNPYPPRLKPRPSEAGWLIQFASKKGMSVSREESPIPILLQALTEGDREEKLLAMEYLRLVQDTGIAAKFYDLFYGDDQELSDAASYALWMMMASGMKLPSPIEFGFA